MYDMDEMWRFFQNFSSAFRTELLDGQFSSCISFCEVRVASELCELCHQSYVIIPPLAFADRFNWQWGPICPICDPVGFDLYDRWCLEEDG